MLRDSPTRGMNRPAWHAAADFAARKHAGHMRKDGRTPYIVHPFRVAMIVQSVFGLNDADAIAAALLHDTLEDTRTDYEELREAFGQWVADAVAALTAFKALPEEPRLDEYFRRLADKDARILVVKLADAYDNLMDSFEGPNGPSEVYKRNLHAKARRKTATLLDMIRHRRDELPALHRSIDVLDDCLNGHAAP